MRLLLSTFACFYTWHVNHHFFIQECCRDMDTWIEGALSRGAAVVGGYKNRSAERWKLVSKRERRWLWSWPCQEIYSSLYILSDGTPHFSHHSTPLPLPPPHRTTPHHTTPHHTTPNSFSLWLILPRYYQGVEMAKKLNAAAFVEVSAVNNVNIQEAVREAVYLSIFYLANEIKTKKKSKETACLLQ